MGCRCRERTDALRRATAALVRGDVRAVVRQASYVGRTLAEDARSGALAREAQTRLARLRGGGVRR